MRTKQDIIEKLALFPLYASIWSLVGYLLATVPALILDPKINHLRFGGRVYAYWWLIPPIGAVEFLATWFFLRRVDQKALPPVLAAIPFAVSIIISFAIYAPEVPHRNVMYVGTVWLSVFVIWLWVKYSSIEASRLNCVTIDKTARLEYIKEQISFWRTVLFGLCVTSLGLIVATLNLVHEGNRKFVATEAEALLLDINCDLQMALFALYILLGPLFTLKNKRHQLNDLFFKIEATNESQESFRGEK